MGGAGSKMSGVKVKLGKGFRMKDGKLIAVQHFRDASHAIRSKKSKRQRPQKRIV
jgi:hypothetical protein